jgi:hypothetical protein
MTKITYKTLELEIDYINRPAEPMTWEYPGSTEEFDIVEVYHGGILINDFVEEMNLWDDLTEQLVKYVMEEWKNERD